MIAYGERQRATVIENLSKMRATVEHEPRCPHGFVCPDNCVDCTPTNGRRPEDG